MSHFHDCSPRPSSHQAHNEDPEILLGVIYLPYCPVLPHSPYLCCTACLSSNFFCILLQKKKLREFSFLEGKFRFFSQNGHIFFPTKFHVVFAFFCKIHFHEKMANVAKQFETYERKFSLEFLSIYISECIIRNIKDLHYNTGTADLSNIEVVEPIFLQFNLFYLVLILVVIH